MKFTDRYPHGVLVEQEGGVPNDVLNWDDARHVCRKHRVIETVCRDAVCPTCSGSGVIDTTPPGARAPWLESDAPCPDCDGTGEADD